MAKMYYEDYEQLTELLLNVITDLTQDYEEENEFILRSALTLVNYSKKKRRQGCDSRRLDNAR